jgi:hypothetical protein
MSRIASFPLERWDSASPAALQQSAVAGLEGGGVLFFPALAFPIAEAEAGLLTAATVAESKNVSWDGSSGVLKGSGVDELMTGVLRGMMQRYAKLSHALLLGLLPDYAPRLAPSRTSFRAIEAAGRSTSWRKDDTRLHVDSFPSTPVQGRRILRVFSNVNPAGRPRCWRLGEAFEDVARRFLPHLSAPLWGSAPVLEWCSITKSRRTPYDHYMLQLHDRMKADADYQSGPEHTGFEFPAQSTWAVFTDQVPHAALSGQFLLEQTFYLPVDAMREPGQAPLRVLERLMGRALV